MAIAYLLGFEKVIFLRQEEVELEGMGKYLLSNTITFKSEDKILPIIKDAISQKIGILLTHATLSLAFQNTLDNFNMQAT